jgi:hypothetical protein
MPLYVVLVPQRQSVDGIALSWSPMEGVASYQIFVASKKLTPEELEAAQLLGGTEECFFAKVGGEVHSVIDDITAQGEARYYGVAMVFDDGTIKGARFKATPDGGSEESFQLSIVRNRASKTGTFRIAAPPGSSAPAIAPPPRAAVPPAPRPPAPKPAAASAPTPAPAAPTPAPVASPVAAAASPSPAPAPAAVAAAASPAPAAAAEDPLEARKRAQREARARSAAAETPAAEPSRNAETPAAEPSRKAEPVREAPPAAAAPVAPRAPAEEDPLEARKRAQREARERSSASSAGAESSASSEAPAAPGSVPLEEPIDARMQGATQTWDGLRIYWDRDPRAAAYEIIASDHQIFADELVDALAGNADFTTAVAVAPSVTAVIDNVTARESRGWYLVLTRSRDGKRAPHPFKVGDAAESGMKVAPFINPNRTGELRGEVEDLIAQAQEQWDRFRSEQDGGARREARRLVGDALLIWPNYPAAKQLEAQMAG